MEFGLDWGRARPDKDVARVAWNQSWETDLEQYYSAVKRGHIQGIHIPQHVQNFFRGPKQNIELALLQQTKHVGKLQQDIRNFALPKLAIEDLEDNWRSLNPTRREQLILLAFYKASTSSPDMEHHRKWCPEMTIANIAANDGKYFMDLLTTLITRRSDAPDAEVVHFPNPTVDYLLGSPGINAMGETMKRYALSNRTYFISLVVWRILLAFFDLDEPSYVGKPPKVEDRMDPVEKAKQLGSNKFARQVKHEAKQFKRDIAQSQAVNTCWHCDKGTSYLPVGTQLLVCSKCKGIGRIIRYCSRECQKQDWKNGLPKPHRAICGKPLEEGAPIVSKEASGSSAHPESDLMIPYPDPNFKRSPALLYQIRKIKQHQGSDYMIFQSGNLPDVGAKIEAAPYAERAMARSLRLQFLIFRRRAFQSGDKSAVHAMFDVLRGFAVKAGVPVSKLVGQLEKEYGMSVIEDKALRTEKASNVTTEEREWAEKWLSQIGHM